MEVDQIVVLPSTIPVEMEDFGCFEVPVEYPWRPVQLASKHCPLCNQNGHLEKDCKDFKRVWKPVIKASQSQLLVLVEPPNAPSS